MSLPPLPTGVPAKPTTTRLIPPDEWRKKQIGNLKAVGEANYKAGLARPKRDPIEASIAAEEKWFNNLKKAHENKIRVIALQATNMDEWYVYGQVIGAPRLVDGVVKREKEVADFVNNWQPLLADHLKKIDEMPAVTDKDMEERMLANLRGLKALKGKWRGRA